MEEDGEVTATLAIGEVEGVEPLVSVFLALSSSLSFSFTLSFLHLDFSWPSFRQYEHFLPLLAVLMLEPTFGTHECLNNNSKSSR